MGRSGLSLGIWAESKLLAYHDFPVELNQSAISLLSMAHDVFISHAHKDQRIAVAICQKLESAQVKCWIAERDISTGEDWTEATRNAIGSSRVMVLVLSENANAAPHIEREIAHAFYTKCAIVPLRLTKTPPKRDFLFYLGNVRWFEAFNSPPEQHLEELATTINGIVHGHTISRDTQLPHSISNETRKTLPYSESWVGALRASHYGALENLKRITIAASLLAAVWLLWFVYSQMKQAASLPDGNLPTRNSVRGTVPNLTTKGTADSSPPKSTYTYTRLGLWVSPNASPTPSHEESSYAAQSMTGPTQTATPSPSLHPNVDKNPADENVGSGVGDHISVKSAQHQSPGTADRSVPPAPEPNPTQINKPATEETEPGNLRETNQSQADDLQSSPSVVPPVDPPLPKAHQSDSGLEASPEEQSLKELVLEYLRTVASNDSSMPGQLFAGRVNFYGKGVLSFSEIGASMERYRREWPSRKWEPKGEPEFPDFLHSSNPDLYEVLQPFDWTVANGSKHKQGSAILYVRIRKAENGAFHIFYLEQRHL